MRWLTQPEVATDWLVAFMLLFLVGAFSFTALCVYSARSQGISIL